MGIYLLFEGRFWASPSLSGRTYVRIRCLVNETFCFFGHALVSCVDRSAHRSSGGHLETKGHPPPKSKTAPMSDREAGDTTMDQPACPKAAVQAPVAAPTPNQGGAATYKTVAMNLKAVAMHAMVELQHLKVDLSALQEEDRVEFR